MGFGILDFGFWIAKPARPRRARPSTFLHQKSKIPFRGFTLIELVLGLALSAILLLGITSAVVLAARAVPDARTDSSIGQTLDAGQGLGRLCNEARFALYFSQLTSTRMTFAVPDRDGDNAPERISYHWSGTAGDPLYRNENGGPDVPVIDEVHDLSFNATSETVACTYPSVEIKSSETTFSSHSNTTNSYARSIDSDKWIAQVVRPNLPADATRWQVSRAYCGLMAEGAQLGTLRVSLRPVDGTGQPAGTILDSDTLSELSMSTLAYYWHQFNFSHAPVMQRGQKLALVLDKSGGIGTSGQTLYSGLGSAGIGFHYTNNASNTWSYRNDLTMLHYVFGYYWTPGPTRTLTRSRLTQLTATVQPTADTASRVQSSCELINRPWQNVGYWHLSFDEDDPTITDSNADGVADWVVRGGGTFNRANLSHGVWRSTGYLDSRPTSDFPDPTTIDTRLRATQSGSDGAAVWINFDWSGSTNCGLYAVTHLETDGTQTLKFYSEQAGDDLLLASVTGLPTSMIDLRLIINPALDEVALFVNGAHRGTFNYTFDADATDTRCVTLYAAGTGGEFDDVTLITGGTD